MKPRPEATYRPNVTIEQVKTLDDERLPASIKVLVEAFRKDPFRRALVDGDEDLRVLSHSSAARAAVVGGELYVAVDEDGTVVGTSAWFPPGTEFLSDQKQLEQGMIEFMDRLKKEYPGKLKWLTYLMKKYKELCREAFGTPNDPDGTKFKRENWNLHLFAVLPSFQGQGIGTMLISEGEKKAASCGLAVCLETNDRDLLPMYEHWGYVCVAHDDLDGPTGSPREFAQFGFVKKSF